MAVTGNDETNIISTLIAQHFNVPRTIALVNNVDYMPITPAIGLDSVLSKQLLTVNAVQRYVRHQRIASIASLPVSTSKQSNISPARAARSPKRTYAILTCPEIRLSARLSTTIA
ncbi:MAG: NAD-binding protein [Candidatus Latescibacterota bacterium]